jgi:polysaccharide biosynthesis/export protein
MKEVSCLCRAAVCASIAFALILPTGCSTPATDGKSHSPAGIERSSASGQPEPGKADEPSAEVELDRRIQPADTVIIEVFGEKDLSGEHRVQAGGTINFPLLGVVKVGGMTTSELAKELASKLREGYLKQPQVYINVKEYRARTVSVMGYVEKPSAIKLPSEYRMDILEAIAEAGGFARTANKGKIDLTRNGKTRTYSFDQLRKESDPNKRVWLQPGDVVYVHESLI